MSFSPTPPTRTQTLKVSKTIRVFNAQPAKNAELETTIHQNIEELDYEF